MFLKETLIKSNVRIAPQIFRQIVKSDEGILTYFKELLAKMTENIGARRSFSR